MTSEISSEEFFDAKYREFGDPWDFEHSSYEQARYEATVECLGASRFQRAFEPGCSIGVLTAKLAEFADRVEALEISETAADQARKRCKNLANVSITHGRLPEDTPSGEFDLIVFSEIGYYFRNDDLRGLVDDLGARLVPGGMFLAVHWLGESPDHELSGDEVHRVLEETKGLKLLVRQGYSGFRLDAWSKV